MELDLYSLLRNRPELTLFLIIGIGYLIGDIKIRGFQFGSSTGVLLAGLLAGHVELTLPGAGETIGFILFIYCVGLQAGPQFFSAFARDGRKFLALTLITAASGFVLAYLLGVFFDFAPGYSAGLLAGSLTSTPTLVAAEDAVNQGMASLPAGMTKEVAAGNITVAYAITYLIGLVGITLLVSLLPRLLRIDLKAEAARLAREQGMRQVDEDGQPILGAERVPAARGYEVTREDSDGMTARDFLARTGAMIPQLKRGGHLIDVGPETTLQRGDVVAVLSFADRQSAAAALLGPEVMDGDLVDVLFETRNIVVIDRECVGRTISETGLTGAYGVFPTGILRAGIELPAEVDMKLERGDILCLTGSRKRLDEVAKKLGHVEREVYQTDLVTFAFGIAAGIFAGTFAVKVGNLSLGIGTAGGVLFAGLLLGFLRSLHPTFGRVPSAARYVLMELGLLFFMASVGVRAGHGIVEALLSAGPQLLAAGVAVTAIPAVLAFAFGRYFLKMNPVILLGAITGSMTSTPALAVINRLTGSTIPTLGYAGTYAIANVVLAIAGGVMMRL